MLAVLHSLEMFVVDLFKSRCQLKAENLFLRHQLSVTLRRGACERRRRVVRASALTTGRMSLDCLRLRLEYLTIAVRASGAPTTG